MKAIEHIFKVYDLEPMDNWEPWHHANPVYEEFEKNVYGDKATALAGLVEVDSLDFEPNMDRGEFIQAIKEKKIDVYYNFETLLAGDIFVALNEKVRNSELIKAIPNIRMSLLSKSSETLISVGDTQEYEVSGQDFINLLDQPDRIKEFVDKLKWVPCDQYWGSDPDEELDEDPDEEWDEESDSVEHA